MQDWFEANIFYSYIMNTVYLSLGSRANKLELFYNIKCILILSYIIVKMT